MRMDDVESVARLEAEICITPWSSGIFRDCLLSAYEGYVIALPDDRIVAYGVLSTGAGEAHLLNLGVAKTHRGQGLGRRMAEHVVERARALDANIVFLEVRVSNVVAQALYKNLGFHQIGIRRGYYRDLVGYEDALVLALRFRKQETRAVID